MRYRARGTATVLHGSHQLDLPVLDVSWTGISLGAVDPTRLEAGGACTIVLPGGGGQDARLVGVRPQSFGFRFLTPGPEGVRWFIDPSGSLPEPK
jgi:hypothetical protein